MVSNESKFQSCDGCPHAKWNKDHEATDKTNGTCLKKGTRITKTAYGSTGCRSDWGDE